MRLCRDSTTDQNSVYMRALGNQSVTSELNPSSHCSTCQDYKITVHWSKNNPFLSSIPPAWHIYGLDMSSGSEDSLELPFTMSWKEQKELYVELVALFREMWNTASNIYHEISMSETTKPKLRQYSELLSVQNAIDSNHRLRLLIQKAELDLTRHAPKPGYSKVAILNTKCDCGICKKCNGLIEGLRICQALADAIDERYDRVLTMVEIVLRPISESPDESVSLYIPEVSGKEALAPFLELVHSLINDCRDIPQQLSKGDA